MKNPETSVDLRSSRELLTGLLISTSLTAYSLLRVTLEKRPQVLSLLLEMDGETVVRADMPVDEFERILQEGEK